MYTIINEQAVPNAIYTTPDFNMAYHEYLSMINDELKTLIKYKVKTNINSIKNDKLYIIKTIEDKSKAHPTIVNKTSLNYENIDIVEMNNIYHIM